MNARRRGSARAAMIAAVAMAVAAGCSGPTPQPTQTSGPSGATGGPASPGTTSMPGIVPTAEAAYPRPLQADRIVEILVAAHGDGAAFVTGVQLESPYFEPGPVSPTVVRVSDGWPGHARVPLTRAVCPAPAGTSKARVTVSASASGEPATEVVLAVADAALAQINRVECLQRDALDAAQPEFGALLSTDGAQAQATLVFTRGVSDKPVAINGVKGNVIFTVQAQGVALPVAMDSSTQRVEIPVVVRASRCDPHAFAESKKTFVFAAWIQVDGREQYVEFQPNEPWRATLQALFDACGQGERDQAPRVGRRGA